MSAWIIPFPVERIYRHPDLIDTLARLAVCDEYEVSDCSAKRGMVESMRPYWEGKLAEIGGIPAHLLQRDMPDRENA